MSKAKPGQTQAAVVGRTLWSAPTMVGMAATKHQATQESPLDGSDGSWQRLDDARRSRRRSRRRHPTIRAEDSDLPVSAEDDEERPSPPLTATTRIDATTTTTTEAPPPPTTATGRRRRRRRRRGRTTPTPRRGRLRRTVRRQRRRRKSCRPERRRRCKTVGAGKGIPPPGRAGLRRHGQRAVRQGTVPPARSRRRRCRRQESWMNGRPGADRAAGTGPGISQPGCSATVRVEETMNIIVRF